MAFAACATVAMARSAGAQTGDDVGDAHLRRGVELTAVGNHTAARVEFQRAWELTRDARLLYNVGASCLAAGDFVAALDAFQRFLAQAPADAVASRRGDVDAAMARLRELLGTVDVALDTPGLEVRVDGTAHETAEARAGMLLSAGRHTLRLSAPDHEARDEVIELASGQRVHITAPLTPVRSGLTVACEVPDAEVRVDGRPVARTPLRASIPVRAGVHRVEVTRPGYTAYVTAVEATVGGAHVDASLTWRSDLDDATGSRLRIDASERDATATLDGRRIPLDGGERVPPGVHVLRVTRDNFLPDERALSLTAGAERVERVRLVPTDGYRRAYLDEARSARRVAWVFTGAGVLALAGGLTGVLLTTSSLDELTATRDALASQLRTCATTPGCDRTALDNRYAQIDGTDIPYQDGLRVGAAVVGGVGLVGLAVGVVLHLRAPSTARFDAALSPSSATWILHF